MGSVIAVLFALVATVTLFALPTHANPSYFLRCSVTGCPQQSLATSSPAYLAAGTATSTIVFDTTRAGSNGSDSAVLLTQFTASSTAAKLVIAIQYSQDKIDWYDANTYNQSTTSPVQDATTAQTFLLSAPSTTSSSTLKAITVATPTKWIRAIFTIPAGAGNGAAWAEFVAKQQGGQ